MTYKLDIVENIKGRLNLSHDKINEELMNNILYITDLKSDDNAAFLELINYLNKCNINFNLDVLVTNIKNFKKMIGNLLIFDEEFEQILDNLNQNYNIEIVNGKEKLKDFKFYKAIKSIKDEKILEVTDWSQMKLFLILLDNNGDIKTNIKKCTLNYKEGNNYVDFVEIDDDNENNNYILTPKNVDWDELFNKKYN